MQSDRPLPVVTEQNRPYWEAAARREFVLPNCEVCSRVFYPIAPVCPHCFSDKLGWKAVSGRGTVSSFVVFHQAFYAFHRDRVPYAVVQVKLDEGPRFNANLLEFAPQDVRIGMRVEITFEKVNEEITLPQFRPARSSGA